MHLRSLEPLLGWSLPLVAALLTTGCGNYTSDYKPPNDGRARAVWQEDRVVASMPADANSGDCSSAVNDVQYNPVRYRSYYGGSTNIVVWRPWIVVTSTGGGGSRPYTVPRTAASPTAISSKGGSGGGSGGGGHIGSPSGGSGSSHSGGGGSHSGGGSSGGGGGGGNLGEAAIVLVVVAILTLPIINLGLGLGRPEPSKQVAQEIDKVNAYNDLARLDGSPCAVGAQ